MQKEILKICREKGFFIDKEALILLEKVDFKEFFLWFGKSGKKIINKEIVLSFPVKKNKFEVKDFRDCFTGRFERIRGFLEGRFSDLTSLRKIGEGKATIIVSVFEKHISKNKNIVLNVEDFGGQGVVIVNRFSEVFKKAENLVLDDIVAISVLSFKGRVFANDIIWPDAVLSEKKFAKDDYCIAFCSDMHVGSKNFLERSFLDFVQWINESNVKCLFLNGDNIEGVGQYGGQENFLSLMSAEEQYEKLAEFLGLIRKDVKIFIGPGQHDAVWVGERQNIINEKWAKKFAEMENIEVVGNPARVEVLGFKFLMYHGASLNRFIDEIMDIRVKFGHRSPTRVVKEILKRRHLAPMCGICDIVPSKKDELVIDEIPDVFLVGDQHRAEVSEYNNILIIASSCWQSTTPFEEKIGNIPEPCKVPVLNLRTREVEIKDFSGEGNG